MKFFLKILFILSLSSIFISLLPASYAQTRGELIVNYAYAPEKIRQGDTWKIYLSLTDPLRFGLKFDESDEPMKPLPPDLENDLNRRIGIIEMDWSLWGNMG